MSAEFDHFSIELMLREAERFRLADCNEDAIRTAERAAELARESSNVSLEAKALWNIALAKIVDDSAGSLAAATRVLALAREESNRGEIDHDVILTSYQVWALASEEMPEYFTEASLSVLDEASAFVNSVGEPDEEINLLHIRSKVLRKLGRFEEARQVVEEGISRKVTAPDAFGCGLACHYGVYLGILEELDLQREKLRAVKELVEVCADDDTPAAKNSLAWQLYVANEELELAESSARESLASRDDNNTRQTLAGVLLRRGKWIEAAPLFAEYFRLEPGTSISAHWDQDVIAFADAVRLGCAKEFAKTFEGKRGDIVYDVLCFAIKFIESGDSAVTAVSSMMVECIKEVAEHIMSPRRNIRFPDVSSIRRL